MMDLTDILLPYQDEKYKAFTERLVQTKYPIIGVRVPALKNITKKILSENSDFWKNIIFNSRESILIYGFSLSSMNLTRFDFCKQLEKAFLSFDNWETTDLLSSSFKGWKNWLDDGYSYLETLLLNDNPFVVRFAIVMYLNYYLNTDYFEDILKRLVILNNQHYYVKMAIAWLMSMAYVKNAELAMNYIKLLDAWTYRKTIQKCIESRQIPLQERKKLRLLETY